MHLRSAVRHATDSGGLPSPDNGILLAFTTAGRKSCPSDTGPVENRPRTTYDRDMDWVWISGFVTLATLMIGLSLDLGGSGCPCLTMERGDSSKASRILLEGGC